MKLVISSGHGKKIRGASGYLDEVDEARRVVNRVAQMLAEQSIDATTYHDDVSTSQNENLNRIVDFHNGQTRDLDVSVHFNAYETTSKPMGTEVLYVSSTGQQWAREVVDCIASVGFLNRGPKKRTDLFFLNNTEEPSILIETCFVDSKADADLYKTHFESVCAAIAEGISGSEIETEPEPEPGPEPVPPVPPQPSQDHPVLREGDTGPWVTYMQSLTPIIADGDFGSGTESALKHFQQTRGLPPDGVCGPDTWRALETKAPPEPPKPPPGALTAKQQASICALAASSEIQDYEWEDRGEAPLGYIMGMALAFANSYQRLLKGDSVALEIAKDVEYDPDNDALSWYADIFKREGLDNVGQSNILRHLYVLLLGLGMRESSGRHCEGRDQSASNTSSDTAEAGLFQTSYDAHTCSSQFDKLFEQARAGQSACYLETFEQEVSCSSSEWDCSGSGNGYAFQELCKSCPVFAAESCAIVLRNRRKHYGPINEKAAEIRIEADDMFRLVQDYIDEMDEIA